jgi:hypothetical protein
LFNERVIVRCLFLRNRVIKERRKGVKEDGRENRRKERRAVETLVE